MPQNWRKWTLTALSCACLCGAGISPAAAAAGAEEISGAVRFDNNRIVIVSDTKAHSSKPRLQLVVFSDKKTRCIPIEVSGWEYPAERSSDLEAICPVPDEPGYFYAAESGYNQGRHGRIFRLHIFEDGDGEVRAQAEGSFRPFPIPCTDTAYSTPDHLQIEGIAAAAHPTKGDILLLGLRGSSDHPGTLLWGRHYDGKYLIKDSCTVDLRHIIPGGRSISDLHIIANNGRYDVFSVATVDFGDRGPYESAICLIGSFDPDSLEFTPCEPRVIHKIEGLKVEALEESPPYFPDSDFVIGTDDESFGGIIRPLPKR